MNTEQFIKEVNNKRLQGGWYFFSDIVNGHAVSIKGYKTWLQIFLVDGYNVSTTMDISVRDFKEVLAKAVN